MLGCVSEGEETVLFREKFLDWTREAAGGDEAAPESEDAQVGSRVGPRRRAVTQNFSALPF